MCFPEPSWGLSGSMGTHIIARGVITGVVIRGALRWRGCYMQTAVDIGSLIWRRPGIRGGRPCVAGTGVSVMRIVGWHQLGIPPEKIAANYGHLSVAQVYAALAYY